MQINQLQSANNINLEEIKTHELNFSEFIYLNPKFENIIVKNPEYKQQLAELYNFFLKFGLSRKEILVYLYLEQNGPLKVQKINEGLKIPRTEAYTILKNLEIRGLLTRTLEKPFKFQVLTLEQALKYLINEEKQKVKLFEQKEKLILNTWNSIPRSIVSSEKELFQIIEGKQRILLKIYDLMKESEIEFNTIISEKDLSWLSQSFFFEELEERMRKKNVSIKIISAFIEDEFIPLENILGENGDFLFIKNSNQCTYFFSDKGEILLMIKCENKTYLAIWTNYLSIFTSYQNLFNLLWDAQKIANK